MAKRSYPTSEVRGSGRECQAAMAQEQLRGATQVRGQGWQPGGATLCPRPGAVAERSHPASEAGGSGWEELPHMQGEVAAWVQEGLEELSHVEGQEGQW